MMRRDLEEGRVAAHRCSCQICMSRDQIRLFPNRRDWNPFHSLAPEEGALVPTKAISLLYCNGVAPTCLIMSGIDSFHGSMGSSHRTVLRRMMPS